MARIPWPEMVVRRCVGGPGGGEGRASGAVGRRCSRSGYSRSPVRTTSQTGRVSVQERASVPRFVTRDSFWRPGACLRYLLPWTGKVQKTATKQECKYDLSIYSPSIGPQGFPTAGSYVNLDSGTSEISDSGHCSRCSLSPSILCGFDGQHPGGVQNDHEGPRGPQ